MVTTNRFKNPLETLQPHLAQQLAPSLAAVIRFVRDGSRGGKGIILSLHRLIIRLWQLLQMTHSTSQTLIQNPKKTLFNLLG